MDSRNISPEDNRLNENAVTHYNALNQPVRTLTKDSKVSYADNGDGTIYLRARSYEPATGRFTTCDSYTGEEDDPLSLHLYTYCENDGVGWRPCK